MRKLTSRVAILIALLCLVASTLTGCGSNSSSSKKSPLNLAVFASFHGSNAYYGQINMAACQAAQSEINTGGGISGRQVVCTRADSGTDPADAVPAADKMLAATSNLVAMLGPNGVAAATEPIIRKAKVVMLSESGDPMYDKNTDQYFYRITPADDLGGAAMAAWAIHSGLKRAAFVFTNDIGAQTSVPALKAAYSKLGGASATSVTLAPDQPSYKSQVSSLLASHPDGIVTETDPQTASTFFSEMLQLNNGKLLPIQTDAANMTAQYENALAKSIGAANTQKYFTGTDIAGPTPQGPAYEAFKAALIAARVAKPSQYFSQIYVSAPYDALIAAALAMTAAKSTDPTTYQPYIAKVTGLPGSGAVTVHDYADGVAALKKGKSIVYVGANGAIQFNKFQNNSGSFAAFGYNPSNPEDKALYVIPASLIARVMSS